MVFAGHIFRTSFLADGKSGELAAVGSSRSQPHGRMRTCQTCPDGRLTQVSPTRLNAGKPHACQRLCNSQVWPRGCSVSDLMHVLECCGQLCDAITTNTFDA